jgi:DNA-binding SARP family transcriptional activator/ABC-type branched-subunit amino acid transport system substrate-binding protein
MRIRLLGPLELWADGRQVPVGGPKQRALLALLATRLGEVVPRDRIVEALWGEEPTDGAAHRLDVQISRLRSSLREAGGGSAVLETGAGGYVLRLPDDAVDSREAERLVDAGRRALADGRPDEALVHLRSALDLWRGEALVDLGDYPSARAEAGRLEELRVSALEERFEAELALGRHADAIGGLQVLVREHPLRERPRAQLMLALYRAGRQREALEVYRDIRRELVEQLGIEPGPELQRLERAVLAHDASLGAPPPERAPRRSVVRQPSGSERRIGLRVLVAIGAAVALASAAIVIASSGDEEAAPLVPVAGNSLAAVDPRSGKVTDVVAVGDTPTSVTVGEGAVWTLNANDQTLSRIDPATLSVRTVATGSTPTDVAAGAGALWVGASIGEGEVGAHPSRVLRLDPHAGTVRDTVSLPAGSAEGPTGLPHQLAVDGEALWAIGEGGAISRIDPAAGRVVATVPDFEARAIAVGGGSIWALPRVGTAVVRIDPGAARVAQTVRISATRLDDIAVGSGAVWAADSIDGTLWRIEPGPRPIARTIPVGKGVHAIATRGDGVWALDSLHGTLSRIDPVRNRVVLVTPLGGTPRGLAVGAGRVWAAVGGDAVPAAEPVPERAATLPQPECGPLLGGAARPDLVIASDLPLQGGLLETEPIAAAITFVLRQHGFRAGRHRIGYQSCDDSTPQSGISDPRTCEANAKAFARAERLVGVVGPFDSQCAAIMIPIANRTDPGPLALVSPSSTSIGLTRPDPVGPAGTLERLYPSGVRNFARVISNDAAQAPAALLLARRLGLRRLAVLDDGTQPGLPVAKLVTSGAGRAGLTVVLRARWRPGQAGVDKVARRVSRSGADAVYLGGLLGSDGGRLVSALRALKPAPILIGPESFGPVFGLWDLSDGDARGMYLTLNGLPIERLPAAGRRFVRELGETQPGLPVPGPAVYAAQATEVLLAAIADSDGTRKSVTEKLLKTRIRDGLIGSFGFDRFGDATSQPVTILRVRRRTGVSRVSSFEGAAIDRVISPR